MRRENDKFHLMQVFYQVALKGSFTKAAESLNMTTSSVSKAVNQLESQLNVKLLNRTTRSQSLTESGRTYVNAAKQMLEQFKDLEARIKKQHVEPSGEFRVTMPVALGQDFVGPRLSEFLKQYPKIKFELLLSEEIEDLTKQGIDLAIRSVDAPPNSSLYSVLLGEHSKRLVASPAYLSSHNIPKSPRDLHLLDTLNYRGPQVTPTWSFTRNNKDINFRPEAIYTSNNYHTLLIAAKNGLGVANLYQYLVDDEIKAGNLVQLFPDWQQASKPRYALFQQRRENSPKVDAFIHFIKALF